MKQRTTRRNKNRRKRIDAATEARVLSNCRRRCCLCFYLFGDLNEKHGQIAHLDGNPLNSDEDNLAFLCLDHHSVYDSSTSQHKNYTPHEVKDYRAKLHDAVCSVFTSAGNPSAKTVEEGYKSAWLAIRAAREQRENLNTEWQDICRVIEELDPRGEGDQELLRKRMNEIVKRQFAIERELFRLWNASFPGE